MDKTSGCDRALVCKLTNHLPAGGGWVAQAAAPRHNLSTGPEGFCSPEKENRGGPMFAWEVVAGTSLSAVSSKSSGVFWGFGRAARTSFAGNGARLPRAGRAAQ